jgi:peptide/nickel transport system substrate-binding protein
VHRVKGSQIINPHTVLVITIDASPTLPNDFIRLFIVSAKAAAVGLTKDRAEPSIRAEGCCLEPAPQIRVLALKGDHWC